VSASLDTLERLPSTAKERGLLEHARQRLADYRAAADEVLAYARAGQRVLAEASLYANVAGYKNELQQVLGDLRVEKRRSKDASVVAVREELARTNRLLGWAGGITLLILVALVFRLHRNIVRPLRVMEVTMTGVAVSLDFTRRVAVSRNDEIGQSVRAFNSLLDTLQHSLGAIVGIIRSNENATAEMHQSALVVADIAAEGSDASKRIQHAVQSIEQHILEIDRESRQAGRITEASGQEASSRSAVIRETASSLSDLKPADGVPAGGFS
jgi:methyl-accepting chemotaxis protein